AGASHQCGRDERPTQSRQVDFHAISPECVHSCADRSPRALETSLAFLCFGHVVRIQRWKETERVPQHTLTISRRERGSFYIMPTRASGATRLILLVISCTIRAASCPTP